MRLKTQVYLLIVSAIVSLITIAVMRSTPSAPPGPPMTASQQLDALQKVAPKGSTAAKMIEGEKANAEASDQAAKDMGK